VVVGVHRAPSARRRSVAITSLAFMFDDVPEPVWKTSIGNWSSQLAARDLVGGGGDRVGASASSTPSSALTFARRRP
jgi:hypothetical protein